MEWRVCPRAKFYSQFVSMTIVDVVTEVFYTLASVVLMPFGGHKIVESL